LIYDFDELEDGVAIETDICIIGLGVAGLTIAREFLATRIRVAVIESGGLTIESETRELNDGDVSGLPFMGLCEGRARAFGGTSNLWGGQCVPLDSIDFEKRSWVPFSGWPLTKKSLDPYYARAMESLWIPPGEYDKPIWKRFRLPALSFDPALLRIAHTIFIPRHNLGRRYRVEIQSASTIQVVLHANVVKLETDAYGKRMRSAWIRSLSGNCGRVVARAFVLCTGPIENARLLLLPDHLHPQGLGNAAGHVGRFLQDHPVCRCGEIETHEPRVLQDHFNVLYGRSARTLRNGVGSKYLPKLALSEAVQRREQVLNCDGYLMYEYASDSTMQRLRDLALARHMGRRPERRLSRASLIRLGSPTMARDAFRFLIRGLPPASRPDRIYLHAISEQAPNPNSRIVLSDRRDALGFPRATVKWEILDMDRRTILMFGKCVQAEFGRLGLGNVKIAEWLLDSDVRRAQVWDNFHPAGTTRMAACPNDGVVDVNCQVHGVAGLYVAGSSVFPNSGVANPVLTITAMSLRLSDYLKNRLRSR